MQKFPCWKFSTLSNSGGVFSRYHLLVRKNETQSLTVRLPAELYAASTVIAQKRLSLLVREEAQKSLYDAFSLVGEDEEESSVAFAHEAQAEVVFRDK
jgi:hypothetical protein